MPSKRQTFRPELASKHCATLCEQCYLIKILVMNSEPGEHMRKMSFQLVTQAA